MTSASYPNGTAISYTYDNVGNMTSRAVSGVTPQFSASGIVNGASFVTGALVPGEIATIFGSSLTSANGMNLTSSLPLPGQFLNASVLINGSPAPLFAVDNVSGQQQINFQVPWELAGTNNAAVQVLNSGALSAAVNVPVAATQPGIVNYAANGSVYGVILHADYSLADSAHPAAAAEIVLVYCTGLGTVTPQPATGAGAPASSATTATPSVTIGGQKGVVSYSGLAPGFVGLNQINVQVPTGLSTGDQPVVIAIAGATSNSVLLPVQ